MSNRSSSNASRDNRANQMNPNNSAYQSSRQGGGDSKPASDNRANQLNPEHVPSKGGDDKPRP